MNGDVGFLGLAASLTLVAVAIGLSVWQRLGVERSIVLAVVRAVGQLLVVGAALAFIIDPDTPLAWSWLWVVVIVGFSAVTVQRRAPAIPRLLTIALAANGSGTPANSVVPTDGVETALEIPGSVQGGISVAYAFSVSEDKVTDVLFDFDACRSVVSSGSSSYVLKPAVLGAIMEHFTAGDPLLLADAAADAAPAGEDSEIVQTIKELLDTRVRPAVAQDGGDIVFKGFEDGVVYLHMQGACAGCPSSTATLKMGIENLLKHYIPEVAEVRAAM